MKRSRVMRLAALLRRLADRLDPRPDEPPAPADGVVWHTREETRALQRVLLKMIEDWTYVVRGEGRDGDGLMWLPRDVIETVAYFLMHELDIRDCDLDKIERDPRVVLR